MMDNVVGISTIAASAIAVYAVWKIRGIQRHYRALLKKQQELEKRQSEFMTKISENIYEMVEKTYEEVYMKSEECLSSDVVNQEKELLHVTADLLEFLRIKSNKVDILHEKFNLNNVLHEVVGRAANRFEGNDIDLIYDIDQAVPRYLIGDARNLEKTLYNLLEFVLEHCKSGEVRYELVVEQQNKQECWLGFVLSYEGEPIVFEDIEQLFVPQFDETTQTYRGLGMFIAKRLVEMMGGKLDIQKQANRLVSFRVKLPFGKYESDERRQYRLPDRALTQKKVLICDENDRSSEALKKMFAYFRYDVDIKKKESFLKKKIDFSTYDIVLLHTSILKDKKISHALHRSKRDSSQLKAIAVESILKREKHDFDESAIDKKIVLPLTQERVFEMLVHLYADSIPKQAQANIETKRRHTLKVHRRDIPSKRGVTGDDFGDFAGVRLLIVEDDVVNQKVLTNLLKNSGIDIQIANNGWQAVNTLKESEKPFDMVLMDINMPIMDGYTATRMIREDARFENVPIVAFTALALEDEREKIFESGMNACLTKPLDIGRLYHAFELFCEENKHKQRIKTKKMQQQKWIRTSAIDMVKGLRYANGNRGVYIEVLREFLEAYGDSENVFENLIREHRYTQLRLLLIDMKGLCASIGADEMHDTVVEAYRMLSFKQYEDLARFAPAYRQRLGMLKSTISRFLATEKAA